MALISFILTMLLFVVIGLWAMRHAKRSSADYLTTSSSTPPWLAGLSAVATNNSGYMFIGMIGYTYLVGISSIWLMIGWIVGDMIASVLVQRKFKSVASLRNAHSYGGIVSHWFGDERLMLRRIVGAISLLFLILYASAQLQASAKALEAVLGWNQSYGAFLAAIIILFYSFAGGLRASIWTDAAQSMVMIASMSLLMFVSIHAIGGWENFVIQLSSIDATYTAWFPKDSNMLDMIGFVVGWLFGGVAVVGQPHIMIRLIALDSQASLNKMRFYYYSWFILFYGATIMVGLIARVVIAPTQGFDAETALLVLSQELLSPWLVGVMLAGLFAATISTADSLILSSSASLTRDFSKKPFESYGVVKLGTLGVTLLAFLLAISNNQSVFSLVLDAWGLFGSSLAPLVVLYALKEKLSQSESIIIVLMGIVFFYLWGEISSIYAIAPAFISNIILYYIIKFFRRMR